MKRKTQSGFTLLEILIAISLFALMMTLLFSGFQAMNRGVDNSRLLQDKHEQLRVLHQLVQQYMRPAVPVWQVLENKRGLTFGGGEYELSFVTNMPAHLGAAGLYQVILSVEKDEDNELFSLKFTRNLLHPEYQPDKDTLKRSSIILQGFDSIRFEYYGFDSIQQASEWTSDWHHQRQLPQLVKVTLKSDTLSTEMVFDTLLQPSRFTPVTGGDGSQEAQ